MISAAGTSMVIAACFFAIGYWGRRNAAGMVAPSVSLSTRLSKERAIRRGAVACQIGAVLFFVLGLVEVVIWFTRG